MILIQQHLQIFPLLIILTNLTFLSGLPTLAAENQGGQGEDERRGQENQQPEHRKYAHNLRWYLNDDHDNDSDDSDYNNGENDDDLFIT